MVQFDLRRCDFSKCSGECLTRCLFVDYDEEQAKGDMAKLIRGEPADILDKCVTCYACNEFCPQGANPWELINRMQQDTDRYKYPEEAKKTAKGWATKEDRIIEGDPDKPAISLGGFMDVLPWKDIIKGKLFDGLTVIMGGSYCCRMGATHIGERDPPFKYLPTLVKKLAETDQDEIIFYHDACYSLLTTETVAQGIEVPFKPIHFVEYIRDWLKEHPDEITPLNLKVAYQRPCTSRYNPHGDREETIYDWIEDIFELLGCELVERKFQKKNSMCCGSGIYPVQKKRALKYIRMNLQDAKDAGAEAYICFCPICTSVMRYLSKKEYGMDPYHVIMLTQKALGEELPVGGAATGVASH
ncbi:MAG: heterodisulfide reductase-related iron-sulfur binding cluster [Promethearchaeia archaeon]